MSFSAALRGSAAIAMAAALLVACTGDGAVPKKPVIRLHDALSQSQWLNNAIATFIIEKGYGYPVESVVQTTPAMQETLPAGGIDVNLEGWQQNIIDWYNEEFAKGTILNLGVIYEDSSQSYVIPAWVAEEYDIDSVFDMREHWHLFTDPQDSSKGVFYNCIAGWHCAKINRAKLDAYGLSGLYNAASPVSAAALDAALSEAQQARTPVFGYYWVPSPLMVTYEWHVLEEPAHSEECWQEVLRAAADASGPPAEQGCAYEAIPIDKLAHAGLKDKAPELVAMLEKMDVGLGPLNATLGWAVQNAVEDWEKAAIYFLRSYEERWQTWVTADAGERIKAALAEAS